MNDLLADYRPFHSEFQIDHFIVARAGTPWGQYQQCLREIATRREALEDEQADFEDAANAVNGLDICVANPFEFDTERCRKILRARRIHRTIADRKRELSRFEAIAASLRAHLLEDGPLDDERKNALERDLWLWRMLRSLAADMIACGNPRAETIELCMTLPADLRDEAMLGLMPQNRQALIEWAMQGGEGLPGLIVPALPEHAG